MPSLFDNPFESQANPFLPRPRTQAPTLPPLSPQDEESLLARISGNALGGLGYVGASLDKAVGGRAIRGLLGGKPEELLSIIPFSDKLGITDEANAVSGKDLIGVDKNDDSWGGMLGGLGAEILLDPGTYLTFGGKTLLGQAAKKAGALPKVVQPITRKADRLWDAIKPWTAPTIDGSLAAEMKGVSATSPEAAKIAAKAGVPIADVADQPLAALATLSLPFGESLGMPGRIALGTGETAQRIANKFSGVKDALTYSPVGRAVTPLFDHRLSQFGPSPKEELSQRAVRKGADELNDMQPDIVGKFIQNRRTPLDALMTNPATAAMANREMTSILEGGMFPSKIPEFNDPAVQQMISGIRQELDAARPAAASVGRAAERHVSEYGNLFKPREWTDETDAALGLDYKRGRSNFSGPHNPNDLKRLTEFDLPGGTNSINDLFVDPIAMVGPSPANKLGNTLNRASRDVRANYLNWSRADELDYLQLARMKKAGTLPEKIATPAGIIDNPDYLRFVKKNKVYEQSRTLSKMASSWMKDEFAKALPGGLTATNIPEAQQLWADLLKRKNIPFANNPLGDVAAYRQRDALSNAKAKTWGDIVSAKATNVPTSDTENVYSILAKAGYDNDNMKNLLLARFENAGLIPRGSKASALADVHVPKGIAADATLTAPVFGMPRELDPALKLYDSATNLTKMSQTTMLPFTLPTLGRNAMTEGFTNLSQGAGLGDIAGAHAARLGQNVTGLDHLPMFKGLTPAEQTKLYHELALQYGVTMPFSKYEKANLIGKAAQDSKSGPGVLGKIGEAHKPVRESLKESLFLNNPDNLPLKTRMNPLNVKGFGDAPATTFAPAKGGQEVMHAVDDMGRQSAFLAYLKQGYEPAEAASMAQKMRMNPETLTGFERAAMQRLIPYYNWLRSAVPGVLQDVAAKPGGLMGASVRASNAMRENEGVLPDYLGGGLAIPVGGRDADGRQRFVTGLGLPFEEFGKMFDSGPNPWTTVLQRQLGNLNPLLKAPLEMAAGMSFYSGREFDDMRPKFGLSAIDQAIGASPLGTVGRTAERLASRGPVETLLGLLPTRVVSADMNREVNQQRDLVTEQLRSNPDVRAFERLYIPPDIQARMSPQEMQLFQLYQSLMQRTRR